MIKNKKSEKRLFYKKLPLLALVIVLLVAGATALYFTNSLRQEPASDNSGSTAPPTEEELKETDRNKERLQERIAQEENFPDQQKFKAVKPIISFAAQNDNGNLEIAGFVPDIYEDGGTCLLTLNNGTYTVTKEFEARKDVSYTSCVPFTVSSNELDSGEWEATLSYSSQNAAGKSDSRTVTIR